MLFFSPLHSRMAAQFRDGNKSRLWKLIVPMKNKSANARDALVENAEPLPELLGNDNYIYDRSL